MQKARKGMQGMNGKNKDDETDALRHAIESAIFSQFGVPKEMFGVQQVQAVPIEDLAPHVEYTRDVPSVLEVYLDFHLGLLSRAMEMNSEEDITIQKEQLTRITKQLQQLGWTPSTSK